MIALQRSEVVLGYFFYFWAMFQIQRRTHQLIYKLKYAQLIYFFERFLQSNVLSMTLHSTNIIIAAPLRDVTDITYIQLYLLLFCRRISLKVRSDRNSVGIESELFEQRSFSSRHLFVHQLRTSVRFIMVSLIIKVKHWRGKGLINCMSPSQGPCADSQLGV